MEDLTKYTAIIDAIIYASNADEVSPKKIRHAIQELYAVDLEGIRKAVNDLIIRRFCEIHLNPKLLIDKDVLEEKEEEIKKLRQENKKLNTALKAKRKRASVKEEHAYSDEVLPQNGHARSNKKVKKEKKDVANSGKAKRNNSISVQKVVFSEMLEKFLNESSSTRTQVVKKVWDYIKEHKLQNPKDKREILCDERMQPIFGAKVTMFTLNKILSKHIYNPKDLVLYDSPKQEPKKETIPLDKPLQNSEQTVSNVTTTTLRKSKRRRTNSSSIK